MVQEIMYDPNEFVIEDGVLLQYLGNKTTVKVPDGVTKISGEAFLFTDPYGNLRIKNIINLYLPESVTEFECSFAKTTIRKFEAKGLPIILGDQFRESQIETVICPNVIQVNNYAFSNCDNLKHLEIPKVQRIGDSAFHVTISHQKPKLTSLYMPDLEIVGADAFEYCACKKIDLPKLRSIGNGAFSYCEDLEEVNFPNAEEFYDSCFIGCRKLKTVNMPKAKPKNKELCVRAGTNGMYFSRCDSLQNVKLGVPWSDLLKTGVFVNPDGTYQAKNSGGGCYVATCVYGSYDCPEVWTLRRFRDMKLSATWYGRLFIKLYYTVSPTLVRWFGDTVWFKELWHGPLNNLVEKLKNEGYEDTPYTD